MPVNWDQINGNWHRVKGSVRAQWGDLTDDEMEQIDGNREVIKDADLIFPGQKIRIPKTLA